MARAFTLELARACLRLAFPIPKGLTMDQYASLVEFAHNDNQKAGPANAGPLPRGERGGVPVKGAKRRSEPLTGEGATPPIPGLTADA